jgi:hypothetical protein
MSTKADGNRRIRITSGKVSAIAELNISKTADAIWKALPMRAPANTWGDEVYFSVPVKGSLDNAQETVNVGDLGYWPPGNAFCIFFGPTPISKGGEIRPASAVIVFGRIVGDARVFEAVPDGAEVTIENAQD